MTAAAPEPQKDAFDAPFLRFFPQIATSARPLSAAICSRLTLRDPRFDAHADKKIMSGFPQPGGGGGGGGGGRGRKRNRNGGGRGGGRGGGAGREGDWQCPKGCGVVYASKASCFKCGEPKPGGASGAPPASNGGGQSFHAPNAGGAQAPGHHVVLKQKDNKTSTTAFSALGLSAPTMRAIDEIMKFTHATAVQDQTLPHVLGGADVLARAKTGSGKTIAFLLPALEKIIVEEFGGKKKGKGLFSKVKSIFSA